MKFNPYFIIGVIYITLFTGMALADVGELPNNCNEPYDYWIPSAIASGFAVPFVLGYFAGKNNESK